MCTEEDSIWGSKTRSRHRREQEKGEIRRVGSGVHRPGRCTSGLRTCSREFRTARPRFRRLAKTEATQQEIQGREHLFIRGVCRLFGTRRIDTVYIALPNNMHRAYSEAAALAGVHILCEKPMAVTEQECEAMIAAAEKAKVKLMIAYRLHFEAANLNAAEIVNSSKLGEPRIFNSIFTQQVKPGDIRLQAELGGGPLYDIGIYCINASRYLFKAEPTEVFAFSASRPDKRFREVDEMASAVMRFPENRLAHFTCSFGAADCSIYEVLGTKGILRLEHAYEMVEPIKEKLTINNKTKTKTYPKKDQFAPELVYFSDCILKNEQPEPSGKEGMADVRIIRALLESAKSGRSAKV